MARSHPVWMGSWYALFFLFELLQKSLLSLKHPETGMINMEKITTVALGSNIDKIGVVLDGYLYYKVVPPSYKVVYKPH